MGEEVKQTQANEGTETPKAPGREVQVPAAGEAEKGAQPAATGQNEGTAETRKEPPPANNRAGEGNIISLLAPLAIIFVIMYLLLIRPQKKKEQQRQEMLGQLQKDDKVVTIGGIIGVITSLNEREVVLRLEDGQKMRLTRNAISRPIGKEESK